MLNNTGDNIHYCHTPTVVRNMARSYNMLFYFVYIYIYIYILYIIYIYNNTCLFNDSYILIRTLSLWLDLG